MIEFKNFTISENASALASLELIDKIGIPGMTIFIIDGNNQLKGSLTDGDIRRGLLNGLIVESSVHKFMNVASKYFTQGENNYKKTKQYKESGIRFAPMLNSEKQIIEIIDLDKVKSMLPVDVILMAGGKGDRLKPLTDNIPKPMVKIGDKPIIVTNVNRLVNFGVTNFHISVRHMAEKVEQGINDYITDNVKISFVKEDKPLGTIGSVKLIPHFINDTVLLMNSDLLTNIDFDDFYNKFIETGSDFQVATVPYYVDVPYAVMKINESEEVVSFSEKPRYTYYSNAGIYLFKKELIHLIPENEVFNATDFMEKIIASKKKVMSYPIIGYWLDIGRIEDYYKAQEDIKHLKL